MHRLLPPFVVLALGLGVPSAASAASTANPDWPCIQGKVPTISLGMVWAGPEIAPDDASWRQSPEIASLAEELSQRRVPVDEAKARIEKFAETVGGERNTKLVLLFTGLFQIVNRERSDIIDGIERYAQKQRALAARIKERAAELSGLRRKDQLGESERARIAELNEQLTWDSRVFDEREQSLTYVCESPVLLEQRLFALAREITNQMQD